MDIPLGNSRTSAVPYLKLVLVVLFLAWAAIFAIYGSFPGDFPILYKAGLAVRAGVNPYGVEGFYSPLFVAWGMVPVTLLPLLVALRINSFLCLVGFGWVFWICSGKQLGLTFLLLLTRWPWQAAYIGNLEWLVLLGLLLPAQLGVWSFALKPQMSFVALGVLARRKWVVLVPVAIALIDSLAVGWLRTTPIGSYWNMSAWPWGIPIGIVLSYFAMKRDSLELGLAASPFLSPYVGPMSWVAIVPAVAKRWYLVIPLIVFSWLLPY